MLKELHRRLLDLSPVGGIHDYDPLWWANDAVLMVCVEVREVRAVCGSGPRLATGRQSIETIVLVSSAICVPWFVIWVLCSISRLVAAARKSHPKMARSTQTQTPTGKPMSVSHSRRPLGRVTRPRQPFSRRRCMNQRNAAGMAERSAVDHSTPIDFGTSTALCHSKSEM